MGEQEQGDKRIISSRDCSALNSKLSEFFFDILDDETFTVLQKKIINIIDVRYGDSIEEALRNDDEFRHLFENHDATAKIPNHTNNAVKSVHPYSSIGLKHNKIVSKSVACDIKSKKKLEESKTKTVLKSSRQQNIKDIHENIYSDSPYQNTNMISEIGSQEVIVEDSSKSIFAFIPKHPVEYNIHKLNSVKTDDQQERVKNKENEITFLNTRNILNLKYKSVKVSKKKQRIKTVSPTNKPEFPQNIVDTFKPKLFINKNLEDSTISSNDDIIENQLKIIQQTKDTSNIIKLKKPRHILENKFEIEGSRMKNADDDSKSKYLQCSFHQHLNSSSIEYLESVEKIQNLGEPFMEVSMNEWESKMKKLLNVTPSKEKSDIGDVSDKNEADNILRRKTEESSSKKSSEMENEFYEDKINKKNYYLWDKIDEEIPTIKTHCMNKLEGMVLSDETTQNSNHLSIVDTKNEMIPLLQGTEKSVLNAEKELKNINKNIQIKKALENIHCSSISPNSDVLDEEINDIHINKEVKDSEINEEIKSISTTDIDQDKKKEVDDIKINGELYKSTSTTDYHEKENNEVKDIEMNREQIISISATSIEQEDKKEVADIKIDEQDLSTFTTKVFLNDKNERQDISTSTTAVNDEEKYKLKDIYMTCEQDVSSNNENGLMKWQNKDINHIHISKAVNDFEINEDIVSISTTDVDQDEKKGVDDIEMNGEEIISISTTYIEQGDNKEVAHIKNGEQDLPTSTTNVYVNDKNELNCIKINEQQDIYTFTTEVNDEEKYELDYINVTYKQDVSLKNENELLKCLEEKLQKPIASIKDKNDNQKIAVHSISANIEENKLHTTPKYKNTIEYVKIPSHKVENINEVMEVYTDHTEEINPDENQGHINGIVQNKLELVEFFQPNINFLNKPNDNDTLHSQINSNMEEKVTIYSEMIINEENTNSSLTSMSDNPMKINRSPNIGRKILLQVVYKKENTQKSEFSAIKPDQSLVVKDSIIRKKSQEIDFQDRPSNQEFQSNQIKSTRKRGRNRIENYLTPKTMKYNLRSSLSETKKIMPMKSLEFNFENTPSNQECTLNGIISAKTIESEEIEQYLTPKAMKYNSISSATTKKRRKLYGHTEIVTRSRVVND